MAWPLFRALLFLWFVANHAWSCSQEDYWKMKLPKVPMPQQLTDSLLSSIEKTSMTKFTGLSSNMDTKEKGTTTQPFTVLAWRYNAEKEKTRPTTTQPFTVSAWRYNAEEKEKTTQPFTVSAWRYNGNEKDKIIQTTTTTTQPFTVSAWRYNADEKEKTTQPFTVSAWRYNGDEKDKIIQTTTTTQPFTVSAWRYNDDEKENTKSTTTTTQPFTVSAWRYNTDEKEKAKPLTTTQPFTVSAWRYNNDDKDRTKPPTTTQPFTVSAWKYNADDHEKEETKPLTTTQPFTVSAWKYNANDPKQHPIHHIHSHDGEMAGGSVFFIEKDLHVGAKLKHDFQKRPKVPLLSSEIAKSIPFSIEKIPEILQRFSISPESSQATIIKETLSMCLERPRVKIENRTCAQSLESLVEFAVQELGTNDIKATMMNKLNKIRSGIQEYTVTKIKKMSTGLEDNAMVTCHRMNYPYVVYYCHHQRAIGLFSVTLVDPKGVAVNTSATCHYDTYAWQPDVPALRYLNIKPGDSPVCHFASATDISWTINKSNHLAMATEA